MAYDAGPEIGFFPDVHRSKGGRIMDRIARRSFLKATAAAGVLAWTAPGRSSEVPQSKRIQLEPFDYDGVRLRESPWQKQYQAARDFYLSLSDDDILSGYRKAAGMD